MNENDFEIKDNVLVEYRGNDSEVIIPDGVASIGNFAFFRCLSLTSISIPNSVTSIGEYAFYSCISLKSIIIPNSVTSIGKYAFHCCSSLKSVTIPNSVTFIGYRAFWGCESLKSMIIPESVTSIGKYAFSYCKSLTSITIPDFVKYIGEYVIYGCYNLSDIYITRKNIFKKLMHDVELNSLKFVHGAKISWIDDTFSEYLNKAIVKGSFEHKNLKISLNSCEELLNKNYVKNDIDLKNFILNYINENFTKESIEEFRDNELLGFENDIIMPNKKKGSK